MQKPIEFLQGHIVSVQFPYTDLTATKRRPALVVSSNSYNGKHTDVVLMAITSKIEKNEEYSVLVSSRELEEGDLPKLSQIRIDKLFTIHKFKILSHYGKLNRDCFIRVLQVLSKLTQPAN